MNIYVVSYDYSLSGKPRKKKAFSTKGKAVTFVTQFLRTNEDAYYELTDTLEDSRAYNEYVEFHGDISVENFIQNGAFEDMIAASNGYDELAIIEKIPME